MGRAECPRIQELIDFREVDSFESKMADRDQRWRLSLCENALKTLQYGYLRNGLEE